VSGALELGGVREARALLVERNHCLTDRFGVADSCGQLEWLADVIEQKRVILLVLRALAREPSPPAYAETIGRLRAARDLIAADIVDLTSVDAVLVGTIRALGGAV
jgi:hypothetical protein